MTGDAIRLEADATVIRDAAIDASRAGRLMPRRLAVSAGRLVVDGMLLPLGGGRIAVVGGGKAAAGMAAGLAELLAGGGMGSDRLTGLVSVPEGCGREAAGIEVRVTRPAAANQPTPAVVATTREMLAMLGSLTTADLAIAVISGGGSALLESPRPGVPLEEVIAIADFLPAAGAAITELNTVRRAASEVKGGGLARACGAGRLLVLVLSDVIGDPLAFIASGPCLPTEGEAAGALAVLERFGAVAAGVAPRLVAVLEEDLQRNGAPSRREEVSPAGRWVTHRGCRVEHVLLGTNATAVEAAAVAAAGLGYTVTVRQAIIGPPETADDAGLRLAREGLAVAAAAASDGRPRAIIEGGEAVVRLPAGHGTGGRNQQTAAAALVEGLRSGAWPAGLLIASIGTDGEDGPTHAAGGLADAAVAARVRELQLDVARAVARCDAFPLLERIGGLIVTGPTGTNVADVRIVLARP
jgi:hydroxypyruvate reductase